MRFRAERCIGDLEIDIISDTVAGVAIGTGAPAATIVSLWGVS